ncbi:hypothetical protein [Mycetocola lacteus]|uniref:hypothetical protein n=1 Tax=Mycetocola lacteus TaxID=76637 RepID=UPI0015FF726D|nr:hypothetical protein [Mycetocola lacteus]
MDILKRCEINNVHYLFHIKLRFQHCDKATPRNTLANVHGVEGKGKSCLRHQLFMPTLKRSCGAINPGA